MMQNLEDLKRLKDSGLLITPAKENNGLSVPSGYKVMRCNLDAVVAAEWDPIGEWEPTALYAVSFYPPFVPPASNNNETAITTIAAGITSGSITFTGNVLLLHSSYPFPPFDDTQPFGVTYTVDAEVRKAGSVSNVSSVINDDSNTITMTANETSSSTIATGQQVTVD
jgi:hypothetical protein